MIAHMEPSELEPLLARAEQPVAVVFARAGFAPSDELVASMSAIEPKLDARMRFFCLDIDRAQALVEKLRVHKVPEVLVWAPGGRRLLARMEGAMRPDEAHDWLEAALTRTAR